jgi:uncharacterized membrane protein
MEIIGLLGGLIALCAFIPLFLDIKRGLIRLNIAKWLLWTIIDSVLLATVVSTQGSSFFLASAFVLGNIITICLILAARNWHWGRFETVTFTATIIALLVWFYFGALNALITVVLIKYSIAMAPGLRDAYRMPERKQVFPWLLFTFGIGLTLISSGSPSLANSFYPSVAFVMNGAMAFLHSRKSDTVI